MILRENSERARQAVTVFQALAVVLLLVILSNFWYSGELGTGRSPNEIDDDWLGIFHNLLPLLELVLSITGFVVLIRWLRRAYWNLHALHRRMEHSDGWAAGAWFVPFLNMYRPYSIVKEVWRHTQTVAFERIEPHSLLRLWWIVFIINQLANRATSRMSLKDDTVQQLQSAATADIVSGVLGLASALLTMRVIQRIAGFEEQMALRMQVEHLGGAAPTPASELEEDQSDYEY